MKALVIAVVVAAILLLCAGIYWKWSNSLLRVTAYSTVSGHQAWPWNEGCLIVAASHKEAISGLYGLPCHRIQIGDVAVYNHKGDTVVWVNDIPYTIQSSHAK
jgi:hypothetical protein